MKEILVISFPSVAVIAQIISEASSLEKLTVSGICFALTVFVFRYFSGREERALAEQRALASAERIEREAREKAITDERVEAQRKSNELQKEMNELLINQIAKSDKVASELATSHRELVLVHKDTRKMHEDNQRSVKELIRKMTASKRHVIVDNDEENPVPVSNQS